MQAIATEVTMAPLDPDGPSMYRCAGTGHVRKLYEGAGLDDIVEWDVAVALVTPSAEIYWEVMSEHVSLVAAALQQIDEPARARIKAKVIAKAVAFETDGEVRVPGLARCTVGTKPR